MFNVFQWNCFNLVDTCNIALILFLKCDDSISYKVSNTYVGLGGLGVTCSPPDPRFAGSNVAEVDGFFSGRKNPEH